jgi:signal transduction histidine kinase/CHASE1-domain containing sensor protein
MDTASSAVAWNPSSRSLSILPYAVLIGSLVITAFAVMGIQHIITAKDARRFTGQAEAIVSRITGRIDTYIAMLLATRGLFSTNDQVGREEFRRFVAALDIPRRFPGIQGIGTAYRIRADELDAQARLHGDAGRPLRIWPEGVRPEYYPIICLEPLDQRNTAAIGFDMYSEPTRREAMERARATGAPAASGRVRLIQEILPDRQAGFIIYVPLYQHGDQGDLIGFVYSPFRVGDLLAGIFGRESDPVVDFSLHDGEAVDPATLLHAWRTTRGDDPSPAIGRQRVTLPLAVAGRRWTLQATSNAHFTEGSANWVLPYFGLAGVCLGISCFFITRSQINARIQAEREQRRERILAEAASALGGPDDRDGSLRHIAEGLCSDLGHCCVIHTMEEDGHWRRVVLCPDDEHSRRLAAWLESQGSDGPARRALEHRQLQISAPGERDRETAGRDDYHLVVPLIAAEHLIGTMTLTMTHRPRADESALAMEVARRIAQSIDRVRLLQDAQGAQAEARTLVEVSAAVNQVLDLDRLVQTVTDAGTRLTGASFGALFYNVQDERDGSYMLYSLSGAPKEAFEKFPHPRATGLFGPTFRGEGVIRIDDVTKDPRYGRMAPHFGMPAGHLPVASYLACPVRSRSGEILGGLFFGHFEPGRFTIRHERLVVGIADQAAIALDNARLYEAECAARRLLVDKADELARSNAELQQFAYVSSHDLKQPARQISSYLDLFILRHGASLNHQAREYVARAREGASRLQGVLDDLLAFTRLGGEEPPDHPVDLARAFQEAVENIKDTIVNAGAEVVAGDLPTVRGNRVQLVQLLQNLIDNAIKFRDARPPRVEVNAEPGDGRWIITVADNGIGIEPQLQERIFQAFQRLHGPEVPGSGIGLAICKKIAERHGGRIWVESRPGGGSRFRFTVERTI